MSRNPPVASLLCFLVGLLLLSPGIVSAVGESGPTLRIEGHDYRTELSGSPVPAAVSGAHRALSRGEHFRGRLAAVPDSWVRLSRVDGHWLGLVSVHGQLYAIDSPSGGPIEAAPLARAAAALNRPLACGMAPESAMLVEGGTDTSATSLPHMSSATISQLCSDQVDGVCVVPELELVFDNEFRQRFPDTYQDQAVSLLNMVEGFYREDMDLVFDTLSITYPATELFTSSLNASDYLESIRGSKNGLAFIKNEQAILHVVTGREFMGGTVGSAYQDVLCDNSGFSSGTSQVLESIPVTAVIVAHEIGHNLGAIHDGTNDRDLGITNNCADTGFIMAAAIDDQNPPDSFSSCSVNEMNAAIERLHSGNTPYAFTKCVDYPVDLAIAGAAGNPTEVNEQTGATLDLLYDVTMDQAWQAPDSYRVSGGVDSRDGQLVSVTLAGNACELDPEGFNFVCTRTPSASQTLVVRVRSSNTRLRLSHAVGLDDAQPMLDIVAGNDEVSTDLPVSLPSEQPGDLGTSLETSGIRLDWTDQARGETGYRTERRQSGTSAWEVRANLAAGAETWLDEAVSAGVPYDYRVVAEGDVKGEGSNVVTAVFEEPPAAPSALGLTTRLTGLQLEWVDNADDETGMLVERQALSGGAWTELATLPADSESWLDETVVAGQGYRYRVFALNQTQRSLPSNEAGAVFNPPRPVGDDDSGGGAVPLLWLALALVLSRCRRRLV